MKKSLLLLSAFLLSVIGVSAKNGAPHTIKASALVNKVTLSWHSPAADMTLKQHNDYNYNGMDGKQLDPQGPCIIYGANRYSAAELQNYVGKKIEAITYFEYRDAADVEVQIYENNKLVRSQHIGAHTYVKNQTDTVRLAEPYVIPAGVELLIVNKLTHGSNQELSLTTDKTVTVGKGNVYSYDGKNWKNDGNGDFIITAILGYEKCDEPLGYNIYCNGTKVNDELLTGTAYSLTEQQGGNNLYTVGAVYENGEEISEPCAVSVADMATAYPSVNNLQVITEGVEGILTWEAPIATADEMTWATKTKGNSIGGTSTTSPKVWVKSEFSAGDIVAFHGHKIKALSCFIAEKTLTAGTAVIFKNGAVDYYEAVPADLINAIEETGSMLTMPLATPYEFVDGNTYAYGFYFTHAKSAHPVGTDNGAGFTKGNQFSVSSPSSSFEKSNPSWKTLASGNIPGNFMLYATMEASEGAMKTTPTASYLVYRNGEKIAEVKDPEYLDEVPTIGNYDYEVYAKSEDNRISSVAAKKTVTYNLPAGYNPPTIFQSDYDKDSHKVSMAWSSKVCEMKKYGTASYLAGFSEEVDLKWGARFSKEELAPYVGFSISEMTMGIGAELDTFAIQIYAGKELVSSEVIKKGEINAATLYKLNLDNPVTIEADKDYYLCYSANVPAKANALIVDAGPLKDGGAMVSLNGGSSWNKLGLVASDMANYNIVISAMAYPKSPGDKAAAVKLGSNGMLTEEMQRDALPLINVEEMRAFETEGIGVEASEAVKVAKKAPKKAAAAPEEFAYNVYCNGELIQSSDATSIEYVLPAYNDYSIYVTSLFNVNGYVWESAPSDTWLFFYEAPQLAPAPYGLSGKKENGELNLAWSDATCKEGLLKMHGTEALGNAIGMTGSGTREGHHAVMYTPEKIAEMGIAGNTITHINFKLADNNIKSCYVFAMYRNSKIFEQDVDIDNVVKGWNVVRLNREITIPANDNFSFGYHITYASGVKPAACDDGPAISGYADLISSSATDGYWYSLLTKYKLDYNFLISANMSAKDANVDETVTLEPAMKGDVTYNVYCNGEQIATGVAEGKYSVASPATGYYQVSCVENGEESLLSNKLYYDATTGILSVAANNASAAGAAYDLAGRRIASSANANVVVTKGKKFINK